MLPAEFDHMTAYPGLEPLARRVELPRSRLGLFYYESGPADGLPVVLLHGLGDEADTWHNLIGPLSQRGRVIAPDLPGFGRSDLPHGAYSLEHTLDILAEFLEALGVRRALLGGSSMGAMLAHALALRQPALAQGLVLLDGALLFGAQKLNTTLLLFLLPGVGEWMYTRLRRDPQAAYETLRAYYADLDGLPEVDRQFLYQRVNQRVWSDSQRKAYFGMLRTLARQVNGLQKSLPEKLAGLQTPTLAIWGEKDVINSPDIGRRLVQLQPSARLVMLSGAGHLPHQERPQPTLQAILDDARLWGG